MQIKQLLDDGSQLGLGVDLLRRFLSRRPTNVELQAIVQLGFVDFMIESLDHIQDSQIIYDICWGITNLSSGTHEMCSYIVARGVIEKYLLEYYLKILLDIYIKKRLLIYTIRDF